MIKNIEEFFAGEAKWQKEFKKLRQIFLGTELIEDFKWGKPCYTLDGENVALLHGFKDYCAILFIKGAAMHDPRGILVQQTQNVQAGRQIRFTSLEQIDEMEDTIKQYIGEAAAVQKEGRKIEFKKTAEYDVPDELHDAFAADPAFSEAFYKLTPGRQRGYLLHFSGAKQPATREARIEKAKPKIFDGLGLNDKS